MSDDAPGANGRVPSDGEGTVLVALSRTDCDTLCDMFSFFADVIADSDSECEVYDRRVFQAEAWEDAFRALGERGSGIAHELVVRQAGYIT